MAKRNAKVILACRNPAKATEARDRIRSHTGNVNVTFKLLDTSLMTSVRAFVAAILQEEGRLDILINNAAISRTLSTVYGFNLEC